MGIRWTDTDTETVTVTVAVTVAVTVDRSGRTPSSLRSTRASAGPIPIPKRQDPKLATLDMGIRWTETETVAGAVTVAVTGAGAVTVAVAEAAGPPSSLRSTWASAGPIPIP